MSKIENKRLEQIEEMIFVCEKTIQLIKKHPSIKKKEKQFLKETRRELRRYKGLLSVYSIILNGG